jgi:L-threonylcarbamoyladenylate synthase
MVSPSSIHEAADVVIRGGVIVYPTDTVYGLGCDPTNEAATRRVYEIKGREAKPVPVLCASLEAASGLVRLDGVALELAEEHWPGPLTIVAPMKRTLPELLHQGSGALGVRVPNSESCLELIEACGGYLVGTSANRSGSPACRTAREALRSIGKEVDRILDGGRLVAAESTVIRIAGERIEVLRKGAVGVLEKGS